MKKRILFWAIALLCLAMTGAVAFAALSMAADAAPEAQKPPIVQKLSNEAPTETPVAAPSEPSSGGPAATDSLDLSDGTLTYTTSADGSTVTISYEINGEKKSYTVPNNKNFTAGAFAATDDLDRSFYDANQVGLYGSDGEKYTGLFYFLWMGEGSKDGPYDLQKIIDEHGVEAAANGLSGLYGGMWAHHHFAEPLYGYYFSKDEWVMRKHVELLCNINIDFLYFDVTNGYTYLPNAIKLITILHEFNEQGYDAPQIVFYTNSGAADVVRQLYDRIYSRNMYPDTWFCIDGKPVIVAPASANINDFFCTKENQWPDEGAKTNGWPWMDFSWPQRVFEGSEEGESAISVSIAQHCGSVRFSTSSLYGDYTNRGRSFVAGEGAVCKYPTRTREYTKSLKDSYSNWQADQSLTNQGLNFQAQWDRAIESDAKYVLVTGWNEWVAQRIDPSQHGLTADFVFFVDTASMEFSRDAEMMRGGYFDNYYIQLAYNNQKLKGVAPVIVQDARIQMDVAGEFSQWDKVIVEYTDSMGDTAARNSKGFGGVDYINETGRNDIVASKVTTDSKNLYFYVETAGDITPFDTASSWMQLYVNTDRETTGWYGYDYIINYAAKDASTTTVAKYNGTDGAYGFENAGDVTYQVEGNKMMISVPLEMLGITGYKEINVEFKWADSTTKYDEMEDFYIDGDIAPLGRLNYIYQNYIPGVTEITYPDQENETEADTNEITVDTAEDVTEITTEAVQDTLTADNETVGETETAPDAGSTEDKGCASAVGSVSAMALISLISLGAVSLRKKH